MIIGVGLRFSEHPTEEGYDKMSAWNQSLISSDVKNMNTILFIDDDPITLNMLSRAAEIAGFKVNTSVDPRESLAAAQDIRPDIIILDLNMPDMDGIEVLLNLRSKPETANIPVLFLSATADTEKARQVLAVGGQEFLTKPLSIKKLLEIIKKYT